MCMVQSSPQRYTVCVWYRAHHRGIQYVCGTELTTEVYSMCVVQSSPQRYTVCVWYRAHHRGIQYVYVYSVMCEVCVYVYVCVCAFCVVEQRG